jgi:hypothetical protein
MAGKRIIEYLTNAVERQVEEKKLIDGTEKAWSVSHAELQTWMGDGGKKRFKSMAKALSNSNRVHSVMPTIRRQFDVKFYVSTHDPTSRYVKLGEFDYSKRPSDILVEGIYNPTPDFYRRDVILHGYKVDQGYSNIPGINTTIKWNLDEMVKEIIETLGNKVEFMKRTLELRPYGDLKELPSDAVKPMRFIQQNLEFDYPEPNLVPLPDNVFDHRKSKCQAALDPESILNGVVFVELASPLDGQISSYAVMHCTHILAIYLLVNSLELELNFAMLPLKDGKKRKPDDRSLFVILEKRFRDTVPVVLNRFVNKAPTFDPNAMCFSLGKLHDPINFDKLFNTDAPEMHFESRWKISIEYSLIPKRVLGHSILWSDSYPMDGEDNTAALERLLKGREILRINEQAAKDLKEELADGNGEPAPADAMETEEAIF